MLNKLLDFLNMKYTELCLGLLFGTSYFVIIFDFMSKNTQRASGLLGLFTAPAIICGLALVFIKAIRHWRQTEQFKSIAYFIATNTIVLILSILTIVSNLIYGA